MSVHTLQLYSQQANGVTYVDPLAPDFQVRFKTTSAPKMLDGNRTTNFVNEIVANDLHEVTLGDDTTGDALSVRIRVSGSVQSTARLKQMVLDLASKITTEWLDENVLIGFPPTTPPINTVP